jgi:hypothetical protein
MIMDIRFVRIPDIAKHVPDLFVIDIRDLSRIKELLETLPKLSAFGFIGTYSAHLRNSEEVWDRIEKAVAHIVFSKDAGHMLWPWLFVAHGAWQPDTRIVRYNKLWKQLVKGYNLRSDQISDEIEIKGESGLRYALSCRLGEDTFSSGLRILQNRSSAIILSNRNDMASEQSVQRFFSIAFPLRKGVPDNSIDWAALVSAYCPNGEIVVGPISGFDDREHSHYMIGLPNQLDFFIVSEGGSSHPK